MFLELSTKHSLPEWNPLAAVVWGTHLDLSRLVPANSSANVQFQLPPVILAIVDPQNGAFTTGVTNFASAAIGDKSRPNKANNETATMARRLK